MRRRAFLQAAVTPLLAAEKERPNILFVISDDQSWLHTGLDAGAAIRTPAFDRIAAEGVNFRHSYCGSPSCAPSRASILTGQAFWRLEQGANMRAHLPAKFRTYPDIFEAAGYHIGFSGKGWGPGRLNNSDDPATIDHYRIAPEQCRSRNPAGPKFANFEQFLAKRQKDQPFLFWQGSTKPHEPYPKDGGIKAGKKLPEAKLPPWMPDLPECRSHFLDYYAAIEEFDRELSVTLSQLDRSGLAENTMVVVTSDNGMSIPRAKTYLYDWGVRMPLAIRWPGRVRAGRVVEDFVSHSDFAPTFLQAAGLPPMSGMTGRSFLNVLDSQRFGSIDASRSEVFTGRERHSPARANAAGYPCRAIRTRDYLYIRNFAPDRLPACEPPVNCDSESRFITDHRGDPAFAQFHELAFGRRPAEELYDLQTDPAQIKNIAAEPRHVETRQLLAARLTAHLKATADPRIAGNALFDDYPFWGPGWGRPQRNY